LTSNTVSNAGITGELSTPSLRDSLIASPVHPLVRFRSSSAQLTNHALPAITHALSALAGELPNIALKIMTTSKAHTTQPAQDISREFL
jgi:hypothetical protein